MSSKYLEGLNDEQMQAATSIDGAVRLIAGAGSGKTFTLTRRVANICETKGIHPSRVLSLTFTNKAAEEMRSRTASLMGLPEKDFNMSTFHSLALEIVKAHCHEIFGWNDFKIGNMKSSMLVPKFFNANSFLLDGVPAPEQETLKKYLVKKVNYALSSTKYVSWLDKNDSYTQLSTIDELLDYMYKDEESSKEYKRCKEGIKKTDDVTKITKYMTDYTNSRLDNTNNPVTPWIKRIVQQKSGICTFDDIIFCGLYMLENYPEIRDIWSNKFDYIQVDEFQDTDMQQLRIVQLLYERHGNLFVVGDPDQSIYLFRGAEPTLFNNLDDYIPNLRTIFMKMNYRSSDEIVEISNKVIEMNKNRIKKTCVSKAGPKSKVELIFGEPGIPLDMKEFIEIDGLIKSGVKPSEIAVLYRSTNDRTTLELQKKLELANIPFVSTFVTKDIWYDIVYNLCRYNHSKDESFLVNAAQYFESNSNFGSDDLIDLSNFEKVNLDTQSIYNLFDSMKKGYKKNGEPKIDYKRFLDKKTNILESIQTSLSDWDKLPIQTKDEVCKVDLSLGDVEPLDGDGVKIMTMHKSKGLEFPYVFVNGLSKTVMDKAQDNAEVCEEKARLAYVAYSRAKIQLYLGCDDIQDMHGVLGQVCDAPYVNMRDDGLKPLLKDEKDKSISEYEDILDRKTSTVYYKLMYDGDLKGYRCAYSLHGEKFAFHAKIADLERLNCVPKRQPFLVKVGRDIQVAKYENNHCYGFDELNAAIRVIDLVKDEDIKAVFLGSNNGYNKDIKDALELDNIVMEHLKNAQKKNAPKDVETNKSSNTPVNISTNMPVKNIDAPKGEVNRPKDEPNKKEEIKYIMLLSKNKQEPIGVRLVKGDKYKDISIAEAKQKGIQPKDCSEKKYIGIKFDITYDEFIRRNKSIKKDEHDFEKVRIEDVDFAHNKCKWVSQVRNYSEVCYIDDFLNAFNNGYFKISNPSALTNWKYWKE